MEEAKLLPCPFCASLRVRISENAGHFAIVCRDCDGMTAYQDTPEQAQIIWNRRTPTPAEPGLREALEKLLKPAQEMICSAICPEKWITGQPQPHIKLCAELCAALAASPVAPTIDAAYWKQQAEDWERRCKEDYRKFSALTAEAERLDSEQVRRAKEAVMSAARAKASVTDTNNCDDWDRQLKQKVDAFAALTEAKGASK